MLRICLILTIVAGLAAFGITHFKVRTTLADLNANLETTTGELSTSRQNEQKARSEKDKAIKAKEETDVQLEHVSQERDALASRAKTQQDRADRAEGELERVTRDRNEMQSELTAWRALGIPVDRIKQLQVDLGSAREELGAVKAEKVVFDRKFRQLEGELARYRGEDVEVKLDTKVQGKVLAIDQKYDFVVIDVGEAEGIIPRVKLMVSREGKLIGKVEVVRVDTHRSIANVLPEWKQGDVSEGDLVLY
jgi:predicted  nucleic acid-binding Zn-ribbon protein